MPCQDYTSGLVARVESACGGRIPRFCVLGTSGFTRFAPRATGFFALSEY